MRHLIPVLFVASLPLAAQSHMDSDPVHRSNTVLGGQKDLKDVEDPHGRTLLGVVRDAQNQPVPYALVYLKNLKTEGSRSIMTAKDGTYHFYGLNRATDYEVSAENKALASPPRKLSHYDTRQEPYFSLTLSQPAPPHTATASTTPAKQ